MKVKTYQHESLQEGLEDIKRDLGSDALILGTRSVSVRPKFGLFKKPAWEITAGVEEKKVEAPSPAASRQPLPKGEGQGLKQNPLPLGEGGPQGGVRAASAPAPARDQRMETLIEEIGDLKKSFRTLSKAM